MDATPSDAETGGFIARHGLWTDDQHHRAREVAAEVEAEEEAMGPAECASALSVNSPVIIRIAVLKMLPRK